MERIPTIGVGTLIYPHIGNGAKKLVHISWNKKGKYQMGRFSYKLHPKIWVPDRRCCAINNQGKYIQINHGHKYHLPSI